MEFTPCVSHFICMRLYPVCLHTLKRYKRIKIIQRSFPRQKLECEGLLSHNHAAAAGGGGRLQSAPSLSLSHTKQTASVPAAVGFIGTLSLDWRGSVVKRTTATRCSLLHQPVPHWTQQQSAANGCVQLCRTLCRRTLLRRNGIWCLRGEREHDENTM